VNALPVPIVEDEPVLCCVHAQPQWLGTQVAAVAFLQLGAGLRDPGSLREREAGGSAAAWGKLDRAIRRRTP